MRVGLVCPYDMRLPGGVQAQVRGLRWALTQRGDEAIVLAPGLPEDIPGVDLGGTRRVPGNGSMVPISIDPRVGRAIGRVCADLDVLHVHEPLMPMVSLAALRSGPPVVATFHAAPGLSGRAVYRVMGRRLASVLGPHVRKLTAVSAVAAASLPAGLDVAIVPNGIDTASFDVNVDRVPGRVSFLGRDEKRKGLGVLLQAWPAITAQVEHAKLVVMGTSGGDDGITWLGHVDDQTKTRMLASSAVHVAPNLGGESFGIVLVEAMAAGTPVVASSLESFEAVGGEAIRYFDVGDADQLASVVIAVLRDDLERARMSRAGKERSSLFDWADVAGAYRSLYESAVS